MKRVMLVIGAAVLFLNTFVTPTLVRTDGGAGGTSCGNGGICKP